MMKARRTLPVWVLALIVVVALAAMGVSYTLWTETLVLTGTVNTGEVDVTFSDLALVQGVDVEGIFVDYTSSDWQFGDALKTATCTAVPSSSGPTAGDGNDVITVTVNGAYPSYHCRVAFKVTNIGTVPVALMSLVDDLPDWVDRSNGCMIDAIELAPLQSTAPCELDIHFGVDDSEVLENSIVTFSWTAYAHQWNQSPAPGG